MTTTPWSPVPLLSPAKTVTVWNYLTKRYARNVIAKRYLFTYIDNETSNHEQWTGLYPNATMAAHEAARFGPITILAIECDGEPLFLRRHPKGLTSAVIK